MIVREIEEKEMKQEIFSPTDYEEWKTGYKKEALELAKQDRNDKARRLKENGYKPRRSSFIDHIAIGSRIVRTKVYIVSW